MIHAMITKIGVSKKVVHIGILLDLPTKGKPLRLFLDNGHFTTTPLRRIFTVNDITYVESENSKYRIETEKVSSLEDINNIEFDIDVELENM